MTCYLFWVAPSWGHQRAISCVVQWASLVPNLTVLAGQGVSCLHISASTGLSAPVSWLDRGHSVSDCVPSSLYPTSGKSEIAFIPLWFSCFVVDDWPRTFSLWVTSCGVPILSIVSSLAVLLSFQTQVADTIAFSPLLSWCRGALAITTPLRPTKRTSLTGVRV